MQLSSFIKKYYIRAFIDFGSAPSPSSLNINNLFEFATQATIELQNNDYNEDAKLQLTVNDRKQNGKGI